MKARWINRNKNTISKLNKKSYAIIFFVKWCCELEQSLVYSEANQFGFQKIAGNQFD